MPQLLELSEDQPLHSRFSFLNVVDEEPSVDSRTVSGTAQAASSRLHGSKQSLQSNASSTTSGAEVIPSTDLVPLFVIKTTILSGSKLFINVVGLKSGSARLTRSAHEIGHSEITTDVDKAGKTCRVITALTSDVSSSEDETAKNVIAALRSAIQLNLSTEHSLPRMRKKGTLSDVVHYTSRKEPNVQALSDTKIATKSLITEVDDAVVRTASKPAKSQHKVETLSRAILSMPQPTMYTHHVTLKLPATTQKSSSWSVYYDSQDSTLKVLLPPEEEFVTLAVKKDDFRAFSRAGQLHIFFVG